MRSKLILPAAIIAAAVASGAHAESYVTFQYAGTTYVSGINAKGDVTGSDTHTGGVTEDFIRKANGTVKFFTVPGDGGGFWPVAISNKGAVTGWSPVGGSDYGKAFVRSPDGTITVFTAFGFATVPTGINSDGTVVGIYSDGETNHGFVRTADGTITELKGSATAISTVLTSINDKGVIAGIAEDPGSSAMGFLRFPDGSQQNFATPSSEVLVNSSGWVVGAASNGLGYVRAPDGNLRKFRHRPKQWNIGISGINRARDVTGSFVHGDKPAMNFVYSYATDTFTWLHAPGEGTQKRSLGTMPAGINNSGVIAGTMFDNNNIANGFIRFP